MLAYLIVVAAAASSRAAKVSQSVGLRCDGWLLVVDKRVGQGWEQIFPASETDPLQEEAFLLNKREETSYLISIRYLKQNTSIFRWVGIYCLILKVSFDVISITSNEYYFVLFLTQSQSYREHALTYRKKEVWITCLQ